jgi:hypothetical protein
MSPLVPPGDAALAAATIVIGLGVASVYLYVGYRLFERVVSPTSRLASIQLALFWGGLGLTILLSALQVLLALANAFALPLALTFVVVDDVIAVVALWGLVGFLTYVYTGRYHLPELGAIYALFFVAAIYYTFAQSPYAVTFVDGAPAVAYAVAPILWLAGIVIVLLVGPELVGSILYLSLLRRTRVREQRSRIWLVGGAILLWMGTDIFFPGSSGSWVLVRTLLEVIPGILVLIAFYPPEWAQRRLGLTSSVRPSEPPAREATTDP